MLLAQALASSTADWTPWAPAASAVVAILALLVALSNRNTARRALTLAAQQEERRAARLTVSLHDAASWRSHGGPRWVGLKILAVNPTDREGALVDADLHVAYTLPTGQAMTVKLRHETGGEVFPAEITALELPARLQANGATAGWLMFRLPASLLPEGAGIERYDTLLQDSRGITATVSASVLREVSHEQTPDQQAAEEGAHRRS
jgi:hypothetical protein